MPTKAKLELLNDELLSENDQLRSANRELTNEFSEVKHAVNSLQVQFKDVSKALAKPTLAPPPSEQIATQLAPLVAKLGEVIATMERASVNAEQKMSELDLHKAEVEKAAKDQAAKIKNLSTVIEQAQEQTQQLTSAAKLNTETLFDMIETRFWRIMIVIGLTATLAVAATGYAVKQMIEPSLLERQAADNWRIMTYYMTAEDRERVMNFVKEKRGLIERQTDNTQPPTASAQPTASPQSAPSATPSGRQSRRARP